LVPPYYLSYSIDNLTAIWFNCDKEVAVKQKIFWRRLRRAWKVLFPTSNKVDQGNPIKGYTMISTETLLWELFDFLTPGAKLRITSYEIRVTLLIGVSNNGRTVHIGEWGPAKGNKWFIEVPFERVTEILKTLQINETAWRAIMKVIYHFRETGQAMPVQFKADILALMTA
jgi:hypothetical protein